MNILIIPTWWPNQANPHYGSFIKEQAEALAEMRPNWQIGISWHGQGEFNLPLKQPKEVLIRIWRYLNQRKKIKDIKLSDNLVIYRSPALQWHIHCLGGNFSRVVTAHRENLERFQQTVGKVDLIHAHASYWAGMVAWKLHIFSGTPFVITEHKSEFPPFSMVKNGKILPQLREPLERAQGVIAVSPALVDVIKQQGIQNPAVFIPNIVNEDFFSPVYPGQRFKSKIKVLTVGGMIPRKGITVLLKAIQIMQQLDAAKRFSFRLGGDGPYLQEYQRLAEQLGVSQSITWLGKLSRGGVREEMQRCDIFVLPSQSETFGVVYAEAIACGKPIIATRCGGPECIVNNTNGRLVDVGQPAQLADAIMEVGVSLDQYDPEAIRQDFLNRFSRSAVVSQLEAFYKRILG